MGAESLTCHIRERVSSLGYDLWDILVSESPPRVFVALQGVDAGDCERVARALSSDQEYGDVLGRGTLEVSSPGVDPALRTPAHFRAWAGRRVRIHPQGVPRPLNGLLSGAGQVLALSRKGGLLLLPQSRVEAAWGRTDFDDG